MPLTFDRAVLGALFTECIVYGICTTMSIITLLVILRARSEHAALPHKLLLFALALMMILATSHIGLSLAWVFEGFILKPSFLGGSSAYFESTRTPVLVTKDAVLLVQTLLGDNIYIWRCYMIWGRRKRVVVVPVITMILASVYTCMAEYTLAHSWDNVFDEPRRWIKGFCGFMLATILYCNVAIIWKIWRTNRSTHTATLIVVIETGTLYTANLIAFLVTYVIGSTTQYIVLDLFGPLVPIVFCLIILQIKYHRACDASVSVAAVHNSLGSGPATFSAMERHTSQRQKVQHVDSDAMTATSTLSNSGSTEIRIEMPQTVVMHHIYAEKTETQYFGPGGELRRDISSPCGDDLSFRSGKV